MSASGTSWFATNRTGFFVAKQAEGISRETYLDYSRGFAFFKAWLKEGVRGPARVTSQDLKAFLAWLGVRPKAQDPTKPIAPKTVYNAWVALKSSYRRWYAEESSENPLARVPAAVIDSLTEDEIKVILKACDPKRSMQRPGQKAFAMRRPTALRDRAIVLISSTRGSGRPSSASSRSTTSTSSRGSS